MVQALYDPSIFPAGDGPDEIERRLWRLPLPLPFALRSVNVYLAEDGGGGWTLFDSGLGLPEDEAALRAGLASAGVRMEQISALVLTHAHPDHIGLAGTIVAASGCPVYMLAEEAERMYRVWGRDGSEEVIEALRTMYLANGLSEEALTSVAPSTRMMRQILRLPGASSISPVVDGETLVVGKRRYEAIWTPGHSDYHLCLLRDDGVFFAGDHVLPEITPNIGLYPDARPSPLSDYYASLDRVRALPARITLPGHGRPFPELARRVDELRTHHQERSAATLAAVAAHPAGATAGQLADTLFAGRLHSADNQRFALVETLAHLERLVQADQVMRQRQGSAITYTLAAAPTIVSSVQMP